MATDKCTVDNKDIGNAGMLQVVAKGATENFCYSHRRQANARAKVLGVKVWDTRRNSMSSLFGL